MKKSFSLQSSPGRDLSGDDGSFPILTKPIIPDSPTSFKKDIHKETKISYAFKALQCSSRAVDDDPNNHTWKRDDSSNDFKAPLQQSDQSSKLEGKTLHTPATTSNELERSPRQALDQREERASVFDHIFKVDLTTAPFSFQEPTDTQQHGPASPVRAVPSKSSSSPLQQTAPTRRNNSASSADQARVTLLQDLDFQETIDLPPMESDDEEDENDNNDDDNGKDPIRSNSYSNPQNEEETASHEQTSLQEAQAKLDECLQKYFDSREATRVDSSMEEDERGNKDGNNLVEEPSRFVQESNSNTHSCPDPKEADETTWPSREYYQQGTEKIRLGSGVWRRHDVVEEKKIPEEEEQEKHQGLELAADDASITIGYQEVQRASRRSSTEQVPPGKIYPRPSQIATTSSFSTVSSFADVSGQLPKKYRSPLHKQTETNQAKQLTPHPFFWRSHPSVTATSYDPQGPPRQRQSIQNVIPQLLSVGTFASTASLNFAQDKQKGSSSEERGPNADSNGDYAPYFHPAVVGNVWLEKSKPFRQKLNSSWQAATGTGAKRQPLVPTLSEDDSDRKSWISFSNFPAVISRSAGIVRAEEMN
jgi:hypothetical protein